ncbi:MAG TPA: hypothetical protein DCL78_04165, partial [Gammaproteobacteria bacterium]|nr:hypothetical protein [Gammaproteobacteria bacterium]
MPTQIDSRVMLRLLILWLASLTVLLSPSSHADALVAQPLLTPIPDNAGLKQRPFISSILDLSQYGYVEREFQMSGTANLYDADGRWRSDGLWNTTIAQADVPYATRLLVRRPADPQQFNGIVVVEWLNNTAFMDVDVIWAQSHDELLREGYAWIGVSAQFFGVTMLKSWDRERYGELSLPNDGVSYDLFSQAANAVRNQSALLLDGLPVKGIIGAGESQSAIRLTTYVNAFQAQAVQMYDAILLY